jgi:glyoxylase-like metal-dependent hydrolase (beta-lactamase superfamily II)
VPHGTLEVGSVVVTALCDGVVLGSDARQSFPGASEDVWAQALARHPQVFGPDARWRLHVHAFVLRSGGRTILLDTGIGPRSAPAFGWTSTHGHLPEELASAGVSASEVDDVVITHVHDDHIGWTVADGTDTPMFPNATYLVHRADWDLMANATDGEDRGIFAAVLAPLERAGVLELTGDRRALTDELTLVHAPGHTPGHQVVEVDSGGTRALMSGDLVNHPVQLLQPGVNGKTDMIPELAATTRAAWLRRANEEDRTVCPMHFPAPFGRFAPDGERHDWQPIEGASAPA